MRLKMLLPLFILSGALSAAYPLPGVAATPTDLDNAAPMRDIVAPAKKIIPLEYVLGKEMVVRNWVVCTTQPFAELIVNAWSGGASKAEQVYADLKASKSCGQFPELRVILREAVYENSPNIDHVVKVFSAQVYFGRPDWPTGFLIFGGLPTPPD